MIIVLFLRANDDRYEEIDSHQKKVFMLFAGENDVTAAGNGINFKKKFSRIKRGTGRVFVDIADGGATKKFFETFKFMKKCDALTTYWLHTTSCNANKANKVITFLRRLESMYAFYLENKTKRDL